MKACLLLLLIVLTVPLARAQMIPSRVYAWNQAPVVNHGGYEERTLLDGATRDYANLSVHAVTLLANQPGQADQTLDEDALVIIKQGEMALTLNGKTKTLGPGSVVVIMPGDPYRLENRAAGPLTYYLLRFTSNEMPDVDITRMAGGSFWVDWKAVPYQTHDKGGIRRMFDCGTVMSKRMEMHVTTLNPGLWSHPPHTHRAAEILLMVENTAQERIADTLQSARTGDIIFLESGVSHAIQNTGQKPCTYFAFQFE